MWPVDLKSGGCQERQVEVVGVTRRDGAKVEVAAAQRLAGLGFDLVVAAEALRQVPPAVPLLHPLPPQALAAATFGLPASEPWCLCNE